MKQIIINELLRINNILNKVPTKNEFITLNTESISVRKIIKEFNSYNNLINESGLKPNRVNEKYSCICRQCNINFTKPRYAINEENNFCSRSCARIFLNKINNPNPKKNRECICENCAITFNKTVDQERNICSRVCLIESFAKTKTIGECIKRDGANKYDTIRKNSRAYSKYIHPLKCMRCGYDKHYEVCHIKPICLFLETQMLSEVNHKDNLIHLCPNCHWELDHNVITIEQIQNNYNTALDPKIKI